MQNSIDIYTDGSFPRPHKKADGSWGWHENANGGWAYAIVTNRTTLTQQGPKTERKHLLRSGLLGSYNGNVCTSNRSELWAILRALEKVLQYKDHLKSVPITLHSDSTYSLNAIKNGLRAHHKNTDLITLCKNALHNLRTRGPVDLVWVKAHVGNKYNEMVDQAANHMMSMNNRH